MKLVLFDFDGTITCKDSLAEFIKYAVGAGRYYLGLIILSPVLTLYLLKLIPNNRSKEILLSHFFKGWQSKRFKEIAEKYSETKLNKIIKKDALDKINWHQRQGHKVVVVSASMECWLQKWCIVNKVEPVATRLEIKENKLTGRFATKNCYGKEKVERIKAYLNLEDFNFIYAYGDSRGDREMLNLANEAYFNFRKIIK